MKSKICDLFGVRYPIIQGGMQWLAVPEFAAAVSNADGLGTINSSLYKSQQELEDAICRIRELTDKPFAVNISMLPNQVAGELTMDFMQAVINQRVPVVETSGRDPKEYVPALKDAGIKTIHKVPAVRFALKAQAAGVDAVSVVGFECGGHPGMDDVGTFVLIPSVVKALDIPVIAGGGVCNGPSYMAARCLGAEGVVIGTRFSATKECIIHPAFKEALLASDERGTLMVQRSIRNAVRVMRNDASQKLYDMEHTSKPTLEEVLAIVSGQKQKSCYESGDINGGMFPMGQCAGLINEILTVKEVIDNIVAEAKQVYSNL